MKILGVRVKVYGDPRCLENATVVVSNHLSYLDIPVLSSVVPVNFLTSTEVRDTFPVGWMSRVGGSVFVDRHRKTDVAQGVECGAEVIAQGSKLAFFPEGTSSSGHTVLPFKSSLFQVAASKETGVAALCLYYRDVDLLGRENLFYFGDAEFLSHLWRLLKIASIEVEVRILASLKGSCRKEISARAHAKISQAFDACLAF